MQNPDGEPPAAQTSSVEKLSNAQAVGAAAIGIAIACSVVSVLARSQAAHVTDLFGGAGGKAQAASCEWKDMVGADVAVSGGIVAGIQPVCRGSLRSKDRPSPEELEAVQVRPAAAHVGIMAGPITPLRCPDGWSVVGIWGAVAAYVDAFSLSCAPSDDLRGPIRHLPLAGGSGGWGFHARCEDGPVTGLRARTGSVVDAVGMTCGYDGEWLTLHEKK